MMTTHRIINANSKNMKNLKDKSVQLIVTSPPYPMIEMWDEMFFKQDIAIKSAFINTEYMYAFELMHKTLNQTWNECDRVLMDNGFICINIGDATRTFDDKFQLFSNHTKIIEFFVGKGYSLLPDILWRKQTNSPNKFMGSGMYPAGAYVTYEHEYILVFRKGGKRTFKGETKLLRQQSAYFWEERNLWFSDIWDIKGTSQNVSKKISSRTRSGSFPIDIPQRLINMYSIKGDTVLDPFCGFGTLNIACMLTQRNSIGFELDADIYREAVLSLNAIKTNDLNKLIENRLKSHEEFIGTLPKDKLKMCYKNKCHCFLVKTRQETGIKIERLSNIESIKDAVLCSYAAIPPVS